MVGWVALFWSRSTGEAAPAGVPSSGMGLTTPDCGTGICMSWGLLGIMLEGRSEMWIRLALLLYEAGFGQRGVDLLKRHESAHQV